MKTTTRKLSGSAKEQFLRRFYAQTDGVDDALADRLAVQSSEAFSSLRVRREAVAGVYAKSKSKPVSKPGATRRVTTKPIEPQTTQTQNETPTTDATPTLEAPATLPESARDTTEITPDAAESSLAAPASSVAAEPAAPDPAFDPYAFGLVPTFQRDGADGLLTRLAAIAAPADLKAMAKAQQIVLSRELRTGTPSADELREAIVDAVARRVADRRSAAS
ncbi:MAG: hypothetical protein AAGG72_05135 [Pseudomonadota bacterium]